MVVADFQIENFSDCQFYPLCFFPDTIAKMVCGF